MEYYGGVSSSTSRAMAFGENNNLFCPIAMPLMGSPNPSANSGTLFLPPTNHRQDLHRHVGVGGGGGPSEVAEGHHDGGGNDGITSTGYYYLVDSNNNDFKAKIMAHPYYNRLLAAYVNCQKIGAPPEVVARLDEASASVAAAAMGRRGTSFVGEDPALDQFMEAYCEMLRKYEQEVSKPLKEAMLFFSRIDCQFKALNLSLSDSASGEPMNRNSSSQEEVDHGNNSFIDPQFEDRQLKEKLLRKYSGYLGSLKQEFMKKPKKGKLPKEARQKLLDWWSQHYKWPYPSESQKLELAESTGLEQRQINNWFINQRKRHWKPSEEMQFVVMDASTTLPHYYSDNVNVFGHPFPMDVSPPLL